MPSTQDDGDAYQEVERNEIVSATIDNDIQNFLDREAVYEKFMICQVEEQDEEEVEVGLDREPALYTVVFTTLIPQPSSSTSTGQPQEPVEELQQRSLLIRLSNKGEMILLVLTHPRLYLEQETLLMGSFGYNHVGNQKLQVASTNMKIGSRPVGTLRLMSLLSSSWFHQEIEQEIERRVAKANEESNAAIKKLEENYKKDINELKKLIISSRNQQEQDDDASE
ncbi:uncharacterized protein G2W53_003781 [Senna tora]|uniref:Uncharacterized protein n=1 Tax=Senna tora TaxID=362788 RepID=A0A834XE43_9FABA|nr:uncharacterized protein G2W53_003781 [Senna tora]